MPSTGNTAESTDPGSTRPTTGDRAVSQLTLGMMGMHRMVIARDGRLGLGGPPTTLSEEIRACRVAVEADPRQSVASIHSVPLLRRIAGAAEQLFNACLQTPDGAAQAAEYLGGRAAALALLECAARRAGALEDFTARNELSRSLIKLIEEEPHTLLRHSALDSAATNGELPNLEDARQAVYNAWPPREQWLEDGKITMLLYVDDTYRTALLTWLKRFGMTAQTGGTVLTLPAVGKKAAFEMVLLSTPADAGARIHQHLETPGVDIIAFAGPVQVSQRAQHAAGTGKGRLVMLLQCAGDAELEPLKRGYPELQLMTAQDVSRKAPDLAGLTEIIAGLRAGRRYTDIHAAAAAAATRTAGSDPAWAGLDFKKKYLFPYQRHTLGNRLDSGGFHAVKPRLVDAAGGYDPLEQTGPLAALDGSALLKATQLVNQVFFYNEYPVRVRRNVPWGSWMFEPHGVCQPLPEHRAFRFEVKERNIWVQVSSTFAHAPHVALERMLAFEGGLFVGAQAGLSQAERTALALSFLERAIYQELPDPPGHDRIDNNHNVQWALLRTRYSLPETLDWELLHQQSGSPPGHFLPRHFEELVQYVRAQPELVAASLAAPKRATTPLAIPGRVHVAPSLDATGAQALLETLGVTGNITAVELPPQPGKNAGRAYLTVEGPDRRAFSVVLGLDGEGVVRAASRFTGVLPTTVKMGVLAR